MGTVENLKNTGLKVTGPRLKILEVFQMTDQRHLSADDVYRMLVTKQLDVGLATVYRALAQFEQAGILTRTQFEGDRSFYEINEGEHHDHLVCLDCGRVEEFLDAEIEARQDSIAQARGFKIDTHALSVYARCTKENCSHRSQEDNVIKKDESISISSSEKNLSKETLPKS